MPASGVSVINLECMYPRLTISDVNSVVGKKGGDKEASWRGSWQPPQRIVALIRNTWQTRVTDTVSQLVESARTADCGFDTEYSANASDRHCVAAC